MLWKPNVDHNFIDINLVGVGHYQVSDSTDDGSEKTNSK
jgi:hypothetical protein